MLLVQLIASMGWQLRSSDIQAAFLQGKPQSDRTLAIEPIPELIEALQLLLVNRRTIPVVFGYLRGTCQIGVGAKSF